MSIWGHEWTSRPLSFLRPTGLKMYSPHFERRWLMREDRIPVVSKKPVDHQRRALRPGSFCDCCLWPMIVILCHLLLAGCAGRPVKVVNQPATQGTMSEPDLPPFPPGVPIGAQSGGRGPTIRFEKTTHDFGQVGPRSKNVCEFKFKNTGMDTLTVERRVQSTCGCAAAMLTKTDYAPGEKGTIQVTYMAAGIPVTAQKVLTVHSNDKENPQVKLTITAKVVPRVAYEPKELNLLLKNNSVSCPPITLRSLDGTSFSVAGMLCTANCMTAELDSSIKATEFTIQPTVNMENLQELPSGYLAFTLTHPDCKLVTIRYKALPKFQFVPALPMFLNLEPDIPVQKIVYLSNNYGEDFEIASFSSEQNLVDVLEKIKIAPDSNGGARYSLKVSITPPVRSGRERFFTDTLSVHLTNGQTLKLDCRGIYATTQAAAGPYPSP